MLDTDEDILNFKQFVEAGGIQSPSTLLVGQDIAVRAQAISDSLSPVVLDENDYSQVSVFITAVNNAMTVSDNVTIIVSGWNIYLEETAIPEGLSIPAQGHDIQCKLDGVENDSPAPFTVPILQDTEILALQNKISNVEPIVSDVVTLMGEINDSLLLATGTIPSDLVAESESLATTLSSAVNALSVSSSAVNDVLSAAETNKSNATEVYYQAIGFTIANSQLSDPAIKDAVSEIYP
ncbi:hypothetical protein [Vibrio parahaemolyticus]|uniref:hypothetical protein n=1 Tax=Vibrio parahaemolyticus TaxID=670 RepID=UPI000C99BAEE|nr:hypothetical protein [Vibrio parahaemolyticus]PMS91980.1 hypothetical protein C1T06_23095 [Vibrio parahaemolyticus]